jgi:hypothetical protein
MGGTQAMKDSEPPGGTAWPSISIPNTVLTILAVGLFFALIATLALFLRTQSAAVEQQLGMAEAH